MRAWKRLTPIQTCMMQQMQAHNCLRERVNRTLTTTSWARMCLMAHWGQSLTPSKLVEQGEQGTKQPRLSSDANSGIPGMNNRKHTATADTTCLPHKWRASSNTTLGPTHVQGYESSPQHGMPKGPATTIEGQQGLLYESGQWTLDLLLACSRLMLVATLLVNHHSSQRYSRRRQNCRKRNVVRLHHWMFLDGSIERAYSAVMTHRRWMGIQGWLNRDEIIQHQHVTRKEQLLKNSRM